MCCVRRNYPEIYTSKAKYQISERHLKVEKQDFLKAQQNIVPASHRVSVVPVKSLSCKMQPLLQENLSRILSQLDILCPTGMLICDVITGKAPSRSANCPRILLCGNDDSHTRHLGPALLHTLEHLPCHVLDVTTLFEETGKAAEEAIIQKMKMARRSLPSLLYVPDILAWWDLVDEAARVVFTSLMHGLDQSVYMLVLTTANCSVEELPNDIASLFDKHQGETYEITPPGEQERESFFKQLFTHSSSDIESNQSSQVDIMQIETHQKKAKEGGKKRKSALQAGCSENFATQEISSRRTKLVKVRNKVCTVPQLATTKSKINVKRKSSASGEGPSPKRMRNASRGSLSTSSREKLSDPRAEELLQKIIGVTEDWPCHDLEALYGSLESFLEKTEDDVYSTVEECLNQFFELRKIKPCVKKEEN